MSDDFDAQLRRLLQAPDPGEAFSEKVLARLAQTPRVPRPRRLRPAAAWWLSAALAASIIAGVGLEHAQQQRRTASGMEARRQVIEALRLTNQKLDLASRAIREQSS